MKFCKPLGFFCIFCGMTRTIKPKGVKPMEVYRFKSVAENGVITLPERFVNKFVEITFFEITDKPQRKRDLLSPVQIDTKAGKWNREEANQRG